MTNTLRIGLIGAPGAGKSSVARAINRAFNGVFTVIDNYAEKWAEKADAELGMSAPYLVNWHLASERQTLVRRAGNGSIISCGTAFESLCYVGARVDTLNQQPRTDEVMADLMREISLSQTLAFMVLDTTLPPGGQFTHLFYLPITEQGMLLPDPENIDNPHMLFDKILSGALLKYGAPAMVVEGTHKQKAKKIVEVLKSDSNGRGSDN